MRSTLSGMNPYLRGLAAVAALVPIGIIILLLSPLPGVFLVAVGAAGGIAWLHAAATSWRAKD